MKLRTRLHLVSFALMYFATLAARAQEAPIGAPALRWHTRDGVEVAAVSHALDVRYEVGGLVAEATVKQRFSNSSAEFLEGHYLLPLPEGAAVHTLKLRIGERVIEGEVREREQARAEYRAAAASGQRTSLVEQHQANVFRTAVANVAPGETVEVEVGYWQRVRFQDGRFALEFPLTFTPRFAQMTDLSLPPAPTGMGADADAYASQEESMVSSTNGPEVSIAVALEPGLPVQSIGSVTHPIDVRRAGTGYAIALRDARVPADRDFVLTWRPEPGAKPNAALFVEQTGDAAYAMVMMLAPDQPEQRLPRELVLVIDTSGSMFGDSLEQAKRALDAALLRLTPQDRFNVIQFNSETEKLFDAPAAASADAVKLAREWVALLEATGGTEMLPALEAALAGSAPQGYVRQVVFATDGAVSEEEQLYTLIEQRIGATRLFPVGLGDAPNAHFLARAARMGRGADVVVRDTTEVDERMGELFAKLDRPGVRDVALRWPGLAESYPAALPDLYQGEPLLAVAKLERAGGTIEASGLLKDAPWSRSLPLGTPRSVRGIGRLWAKAKIDSLDDELRRGGDTAVVRAKIVDVALAHHLVTRYTSLVAVDRTPVRPADAALRGVDLANGMDDDALALAQGATPAPALLALGLLGLLLACVSRMPRRVLVSERRAQS